MAVATVWRKQLETKKCTLVCRRFHRMITSHAIHHIYGTQKKSTKNAKERPYQRRSKVWLWLLANSCLVCVFTCMHQWERRFKCVVMSKDHINLHLSVNTCLLQTKFDWTKKISSSLRMLTLMRNTRYKTDEFHINDVVWNSEILSTWQRLKWKCVSPRAFSFDLAKKILLFQAFIKNLKWLQWKTNPKRIQMVLWSNWKIWLTLSDFDFLHFNGISKTAANFGISTIFREKSVNF